MSLADGHDPSGVTVSAGSEHSVVVGPDGSYIIGGLHGSIYTVTATLDGYGPVAQTVTVMADEAVGGIDFTLQPVVAFNETASPNADIPDNDPDGISSVINVAAAGSLQEITVDIDISHASIGNLVVTITSPEGTTITLHNRTGGTIDDLVGNWPETFTVDGPGLLSDLAGESVEGDWILNVADLQFGAWGTFNSWGLNLLVVPSITAVTPNDLPTTTRLAGNAPNPFNPLTVIAFDLAVAGPVQLDVFDVQGRRVRRLQSGAMAAGTHRITWDGRDSAGRETSSGVYFCRLTAGNQVHLHKMTLVR